MQESRPRILCVEDHSDFCTLVAVLLPEFEIISTGTIAAAVRMASEEIFALILMDYHLPDGTGEEACELIRAFDPVTPILFVTGEQFFTETKARAIGAHGCLKKATPDFIHKLRDRSLELTQV